MKRTPEQIAKELSKATTARHKILLYEGVRNIDYILLTEQVTSLRAEQRRVVNGNS